jgi:hypothetical protein
METCFQIILGKFDVRQLLESNAVFGPLIFSLYNIIIVFLLVNIFISVLTDHYSQVKENKDLNLHDPEILDYLKLKFRSISELFYTHKRNEKELSKYVYENITETFQKKIDELMQKIVKIESN